MTTTDAEWGTPQQGESVAALIDLATDDWTDICALTGEVGRQYGRGVDLREATVAVGELVGVLIDNGIVPGHLHGEFVPGADPSKNGSIRSREK